MLEENRISFSVMYSLRCAIASDNLPQIMNIFAEHSSLTPDSYFEGGSSALHYACTIGAANCAGYFLKEWHCNPNSVNSQYGMPPAHMAAIPGRMDIVTLLHAAGADLSQLDNEGENILHKAVLAGDIGFLKELIKRFKLKTLLIQGNHKGREPAAFLEKLVKKGQHPKQLSREVGEADDAGLMEILGFLQEKAERVRRWESRKNLLMVKYLVGDPVV
jgi:hypothetical protein